jgi:hypothetical protein
MKTSATQILSIYFFVMAVTSMNAQNSTCTFQSPAQQAALIELFTSEGCSSCPPAENWLSRLETSPRLWKDLVPLAFHVDYWDRLGWRDPWARKAFSARQNEYARLWGGDSVYTPGVVLNGREWLDWPQYRDGPKPSGAKPGVLTVNSSDTNHWWASFAPASVGEHNYEVHAALLAGGLSSDVKAGENRGRRLIHDFAALSLVHASLSRSNGLAQGEFVLPSQTNAVNGSRALAVWVTEAGHPDVVQATGGWLVKPASKP